MYLLSSEGVDAISDIPISKLANMSLNLSLLSSKYLNILPFFDCIVSLVSSKQKMITAMLIMVVVGFYIYMILKSRKLEYMID